jgi:hypothetical protein
MDQLRILQGPNQTDCLVVAENDRQKAWLETPHILTILFGEAKKAFPSMTSIMVVSGSVYEFLAAEKAELIYSKVTPPSGTDEP